MIPRYHVVDEAAFSDLTGAEIIAIEQAERYGTDMVIGENGRVVHISPAEMRQRLGYPEMKRPT